MTHPIAARELARRPRTDAELQAKWDAMPGPWVKRKRGLFYMPNNCGYTDRIEQAGFYPKDEAKAYAAESGGEVTCRPVMAYREDLVRAVEMSKTRLDQLDAAIAAAK